MEAFLSFLVRVTIGAQFSALLRSETRSVWSLEEYLLLILSRDGWIQLSSSVGTIAEAFSVSLFTGSLRICVSFIVGLIIVTRSFRLWVALMIANGFSWSMCRRVVPLFDAMIQESGPVFSINLPGSHFPTLPLWFRNQTLPPFLNSWWTKSSGQTGIGFLIRFWISGFIKLNTFTNLGFNNSFADIWLLFLFYWFFN